MQNQDYLKTLSHSELACLEEISQCGEITPQAYNEPVLLRLIELGLIEKESPVWLPLEMKQDRYQLTSLGHQVVSKSE